jgi:photosystem II stability/assembly factor-like uncharacterized protein
VSWRWAGRPFIGQDMEAVAVDRSQAGALWAATTTAVYRTEDGGSRWIKISDETYSLPSPWDGPKGIIAVPGALFVVTGEVLLASTDGGRTWENLYSRGSIGVFGALSSQILFLVSSGRPERDLLRSLDGGRTWTSITSCPPDVQQIIPTATAVYVVETGNAPGLLRSTDLGQTWKAMLGGTASQTFEVTSVTVDSREPRALYVSGIDPQRKSGLWFSRNDGDSWTQAGQQYFRRLQIDPSSGAFYGSRHGSSLERSLDGGATWTTVLRSPNPEWNEAARINFRPGDPARVALAVGFTLYRSLNGGSTWKLSNSLPGAYDVDIDPADPNRLIATTEFTIYLSEDAGQTWQRVGNSGEARYLEILIRSDGQTLLAGGAGICRSGDNGQSWETVLPGWPQGSETARWTQKLEADPVHPSTVYALTFQVHLDSLPHGPLAGLGPSILWRSLDSGKTWKKMALNLSTFAVDPATSRLYGIRNGKVLASDDGGKTWRQIGRKPGGTFDLVIDPADPRIFYTVPSLWQSRDRGVTWTRMNVQDWPGLYVLTIDPRNSRVLYGADRVSVYTITLPN